MDILEKSERFFILNGPRYDRRDYSIDSNIELISLPPDNYFLLEERITRFFDGGFSRSSLIRLLESPPAHSMVEVPLDHLHNYTNYLELPHFFVKIEVYRGILKIYTMFGSLEACFFDSSNDSIVLSFWNLNIDKEMYKKTINYLLRQFLDDLPFLNNEFFKLMLDNTVRQGYLDLFILSHYSLHPLIENLL